MADRGEPLAPRPLAVGRQGVDGTGRHPQAELSLGRLGDPPQRPETLWQELLIHLPNALRLRPTGVDGHHVEKHVVTVVKPPLEFRRQIQHVLLREPPGQRPPGVVAARHARGSGAHVIDVPQERGPDLARLSDADHGRVQVEPLRAHARSARAAAQHESVGTVLVERSYELDAHPKLVAVDRMTSEGMAVGAHRVPRRFQPLAAVQFRHDQPPGRAAGLPQGDLLSHVGLVRGEGVPHAHLDGHSAGKEQFGLIGASAERGRAFPGVQLCPIQEIQPELLGRQGPGPASESILQAPRGHLAVFNRQNPAKMRILQHAPVRGNAAGKARLADRDQAGDQHCSSKERMGHGLAPVVCPGFLLLVDKRQNQQ